MITFIIGFGADKLTNDRANRKHAVPTVMLWNASKKTTELEVLVLEIYADRSLLVMMVILIVVVVSLSRTTMSTM